VTSNYHIVFDGFPAPDGPRFIELEDDAGRSINAGEWRERPDGLAELVLSIQTPPPQSKKPDQQSSSDFPDLPRKIWIDVRNLSVHLTGGDNAYLLPFASVPAPKRHEHYKNSEEIARIRELAAAGLRRKEIAAKLNISPTTVRKFAGPFYKKVARS
jgi:hypothetical protein